VAGPDAQIIALKLFPRATAMDAASLELSEIGPAGYSSARQTVELAVVIPTFNERDNVSPLLERLEATLEVSIGRRFSWTTCCVRSRSRPHRFVSSVELASVG
jgi:hypothetical protein